MTQCAVILSGAGVFDGSELHEASLCYYFLDKHGINTTFIAPNCNQRDVINHQDSTPHNSQRQCLNESNRIARGEIVTLNNTASDLYDMVIFPGGFGAAKTLSSFAVDGDTFDIHPEIKAFSIAMHRAKKPQGFLCISPVIAAKLFPEVICTLGLDQQNIDILDQLGAQGRQATEADVVIDRSHHIFSTPAYMIDTSISKIAVGIELLIVEMIHHLESTSSKYV